MLRLLILCCLSLLLSSCGFTLRGNAQLPPSLQALYFDSSNDNTRMGRELMKVLVSNKVPLSSEPGAAGYTLTLGNESLTERPLSVNANARAGEYEIVMTVPFRLKLGNAAALPPQLVSVNKVYLADPENAVAKAEEAVIIQNEMRQQLAQLILRRLQSFTP